MEYQVGQILRLGRYDWRIRRITGAVITLERVANDGRVLTKIFTANQLAARLSK